MKNYTVVLIISLVFLLVLSTLFSACETSFSSANRIKLKNMAARKNKRAKLALKVLDMYGKLLSAILIGNTIVSISLSALATLLFVEMFGIAGVSIATVTITILVLLIGEISPKSLAKESPERFALVLAPFLRFFILFFTPIIFFTEAWKKLIMRVFPAKDSRAITEEELLTFVESVRQEGGINRQEEKLIRQVIEFDDLTAAEICTPRMDIAAIEENDSVSAINAKFAESGFSRLPVCQGSVDTIIGLLLLKDFHHEVIDNGKPPASVFKPVVFVAKTIKIPRLLQAMQKKRTHLAVVVDEFGGTLGIVTNEDILEELVGEIWDEHDEVEVPIAKTGDGAYRVRGNLTLPAMFEFIRAAESAGKPPAADEGADTDESPQKEVPSISVGSWALENLGGLPKAGDQFSSLDVHLTVSKVYRHRVLEAVVTVNKSGA